MNNISLDKNKCISNKIKVGSCIQLNCLLDFIVFDISRIDDFLIENEDLLSNQNLTLLLDKLSCIRSDVTDFCLIVLNDIDKNEPYCDYLRKFY